MRFDEYIAELKAVILNLHGAIAEHVETVPVLEQFQDGQFGKAKLKCSICKTIRKQRALMVGAIQRAMTINRGAT